MSIQTNDLVIREDIISNFNSRIRDWVATYVTLLGTTPVTASTRVSTGVNQSGNGVPSTNYLSYPVGSTDYNTYSKIVTLNTTVGAIAANSTTYGGTVNATIDSVALPSEVMTSETFSADIGAGQTQTGHVVKVIKDFLRIYSKIHAIELQNTGNIAPFKISGVAKSSNIPTAAANLIDSDVDALANVDKFKSGAELDPVKFKNFVESCRTIWHTRCIASGALEIFKFNYCHNSCHSNYTCYNSRGRR